MLHHPALDKLNELRLFGMRAALIEQYDLPDIEALSFEERIALLVEREYPIDVCVTDKNVQWWVYNNSTRRGCAVPGV